MAKKEFTTEISNELMNIYLLLGIDKPINHEDIIQFVSELAYRWCYVLPLSNDY